MLATASKSETGLFLMIPPAELGAVSSEPTAPEVPFIPLFPKSPTGLVLRMGTWRWIYQVESSRFRMTVSQRRFSNSD